MLKLGEEALNLNDAVYLVQCTNSPPQEAKWN